jgi:hypothetical protein
MKLRLVVDGSVPLAAVVTPGHAAEAAHPVGVLGSVRLHAGGLG